MRVLVTADLHYNHGRSTALADDVIDRMNATAHEGDVLLLVGDTAAYDGDALERCLSRFRFDGPKLFVAGNHELWTRGPDSYAVFKEELPKRVRELGWRWLQDEPFVFSPSPCTQGEGRGEGSASAHQGPSPQPSPRVLGEGDRRVAIVGSIAWYDYGFHVTELGIPQRFYEHGVSPGAVSRVDGFESLRPEAEDVSPHAREIVARWNDAKFVKLHRPDDSFLDELLTQLEEQLSSLRSVHHVIAAVHHVPFAQLLPPRRGGQWDFARAYLGSPRIGELLLRYANVRHVLCGHSHFGVDARVAHIDAINIGSGYRQKAFRILELA